MTILRWVFAYARGVQLLTRLSSDVVSPPAPLESTSSTPWALIMVLVVVGVAVVLGALRALRNRQEKSGS
jgi:hypothetical protein